MIVFAEMRQKGQLHIIWGHPCTFVVDQRGQIAYIGNPFYLDVVLDKVVAGKSTAKVIGAEMCKIQDEYNDIQVTRKRGSAIVDGDQT